MTIPTIMQQAHQIVQEEDYSYRSFTRKGPVDTTRNDRKLKSSVQTKTKKSVSFARKVCVRNALHLNNYTFDEVDACWYDDEAYLNMKRSVVKLARHMSTRESHKLPSATPWIDDDDESDENSEECFRGLEGYTREGARKRRSCKNACRKAVLDEQAWLWEEGYQYHEDAWDCIAEVSRDSSLACQWSARALALKDQLDAFL